MKRAKALTRSALRSFPLPAVEDGDKNEHGRLLIIAGSRKVPGAAMLATRAGMRTGAGKVRVATVASVATVLALKTPEALVVSLAEARDGGFKQAAVRQAAEEALSVDAVVAGPGVAESPVGTAMSKALVETGRPIVFDAGLLHCLTPAAAHCRRAGTPPILLPHSREMASLLGTTEDEIEKDRLSAAHEAAESFGAFVLAKGTPSYIAAPDGRAWAYNGGVPGLGVAGSGDTLSGIVGALIARGQEPLAALLWGVLLHGEAGEALSKKVGPVGFLAREIPDEIPALLQR
jgi:hydroxyethylthiazole kinase-like uncharacterized protein yjeF